jgi:histidinol phosphatase-like PHP family hydrolase
MFNLHCHSLLSDGVLLPSEISMRYLHAGYKIIAITDHVDYSNIEFVVKSIVKFTKHWPAKNIPITVLPGIELSHLPPEQFSPLAKYARKKGIKIIVAHGESPVEPVIKGANRAALEADIDILAHPGLITEENVLIAKKKNIFLEITSRRGHSNTNAHVAQLALKVGAKLVLNHDSHTPEDIISPAELVSVGMQAGLTQEQIDLSFKEVESFLKRRQ